MGPPPYPLEYILRDATGPDGALPRQRRPRDLGDRRLPVHHRPLDAGLVPRPARRWSRCSRTACAGTAGRPRRSASPRRNSMTPKTGTVRDLSSSCSPTASPTCSATPGRSSRASSTRIGATTRTSIHPDAAGDDRGRDGRRLRPGHRSGPALVQLHSGVGLGNGIGMLYQAKRGHAPLVVIAGEAGVRYDAMDAQMAADLVAMAEPVTKWATRVIDPASLLRVLRRAIKIAATPPMRAGRSSPCRWTCSTSSTEEAVVPTSIPDTRVVAAPERWSTRPADLLARRRAADHHHGRRRRAVRGPGRADRVAELLGAECGARTPPRSTSTPRTRSSAASRPHVRRRTARGLVGGADAVLIVGTYVFPEVFPTLASVFRRTARRSSTSTSTPTRSPRTTGRPGPGRRPEADARRAGRRSSAADGARPRADRDRRAGAAQERGRSRVAADLEHDGRPMHASRSWRSWPRRRRRTRSSSTRR